MICNYYKTIRYICFSHYLIHWIGMSHIIAMTSSSVLEFPRTLVDIAIMDDASLFSRKKRITKLFLGNNNLFINKKTYPTSPLHWFWSNLFISNNMHIRWCRQFYRPSRDRQQRNMNTIIPLSWFCDIFCDHDNSRFLAQNIIDLVDHWGHL